MKDLLWIAGLGWAAVLIGIGIACLPFVLKWARIAGAARAAALRWHYILPFAVAALSFAHAWLSMSTGRLRGIDMTGLWLASVALALLFVQLAVGIELRNARTRLRLRRAHFVVMTALVALIAAHIELNRV